MYSRRLVLRVSVVAAVVLAAFAYSFEKEPVRGIDLDGSRLIATEKIPEALESCTWDLAAPERPALQGQRAGAGAGPAMGDPNVAARMPARTIRDPYAGFAAIRVDPVRNEVVVMDEF